MALTRQISRRALVLQPTNAEVSTSQVQAPFYEFVVDGELTIPVEAQFDSARHLEAAQNMHLAVASVKVAGTSQYRIRVVSVDANGINAVTHIDQTVLFTADNGLITLPFITSLVPQNRSLLLYLTEALVGTPSSDLSVTLIAEPFSQLTQVRNGHLIQDSDGNTLPQQDSLQFAGPNVALSDEPANQRTVVTVDAGFIGQVLDSMLTEIQMQSIYGSGWIIADGRSVAGSMYETITGSSNVPDLRGTVLRAKNNGRSDGNENPAGDLALGAYQSDAFQGHDHGIRTDSNGLALGGWNTWGINASAGTRGDVVEGPVSDGVNGTPRIANETRVKSHTINRFIKIA